VATTNPHLGDNRVDSARYGRIKINQAPLLHFKGVTSQQPAYTGWLLMF
jgi:hypothetical protein